MTDYSSLLERSRAVRAGRRAEPLPDDPGLFDRARAAALARQGLVDDVTPAGRWLWLLSSVPGFWDQFLQVPAAFWEPTAERVDDGSVSIAVVACPCGQRPNVEADHVTHCDCQRSYLHLAGRVFVAFGPTQDPAPSCELPVVQE